MHRYQRLFGRPREAGLPPGWALRAAAAILVVASACSSPDSSLRSDRSQADKRITGAVLARAPSSAAGPGDRLVSVDLPSGRMRAFRGPEKAGFPFEGFWLDGAARGPEAVELADFDGRGARLFRLSLDRPPQALGPLLRGPVADTDASGSLVAVARCGRPSAPEQRDGVFVIDVNHPTRWRRVARGCSAALSPDGSRVAYSPDGRTIRTLPLDGSGSSEVVADLDALGRNIEGKGLRPAGSLKRGGGGRISPADLRWGPGGIALGVRSRQSNVIVVARPGERPVFEAITPADNDFFPVLSWRPESDSLGVLSNSGGYVDAIGVVRLFDPRRAELEVISAVSQPSYTMVWSPSGDALVTGDDRNAWTFISPSGRWIEQLPSPRAIPLDWRQ